MEMASAPTVASGFRLPQVAVAFPSRFSPQSRLALQHPHRCRQKLSASPAFGARSAMSAPAASNLLVSALPLWFQSIAEASRSSLQTLAASSAAVAFAQPHNSGKFLIGASAPLFFASMTTVATPLTVVASGMAKWLELYSAVLMIRVLLSWFPNIPWERQPFMAIRDMCDPYLNLFRNIIPPLFNALDLSPLLAFMVLGTLATILNLSAQA